ITLTDQRLSILARVLSEYSEPFWNLMRMEQNPHIQRFVQAVERCRWTMVSSEVLPELLFHLLIYEHHEEGIKYSVKEIRTSFTSDGVRPWGLGPIQEHWDELHGEWYQPYRHDIIGNTLSADPLDYLLRDCRRLGIDRRPDLRLLSSYVLVDVTKQ